MALIDPMMSVMEIFPVQFAPFTSNADDETRQYQTVNSDSVSHSHARRSSAQTGINTGSRKYSSDPARTSMNTERTECDVRRTRMNTGDALWRFNDRVGHFFRSSSYPPVKGMGGCI
jgi:hypothetical protein